MAEGSGRGVAEGHIHSGWLTKGTKRPERQDGRMHAGPVDRDDHKTAGGYSATLDNGSDGAME